MAKASAARKKTKAKPHPVRAKTNHRAATKRGHHRPANANEPSLSSRPMWQGRCACRWCPVR